MYIDSAYFTYYNKKSGVQEIPSFSSAYPTTVFQDSICTKKQYYCFFAKKTLILYQTKKMAASYSKFTYDDLDALQISVQTEPLHLDTYPLIEPSAWLKETLELNMQLPLASEKAKSEGIIAPILSDLVRRNHFVFTYFSGYNFSVDKAHGLSGRCDFLLSKSPKARRIETPVLSIVEAKNDNLEEGIPQCIAQLYAANLFNQKHGLPSRPIYGSVTYAFSWQFIRLDDKQAFVDNKFYSLEHLPQIMGILQHIVDSYN